MRKVISILLILLLAGLLAAPVCAAPEEPVITMQPQSSNYTEYAVAVYTVKATGSNLTATWYISYQGKTYNASQIGGAMQPWEAYAGESYGARKIDENTFSFVFEGIEKELNGASIWCVLEDGHYDVTSQKAQICVGSTAEPPQILSIPSTIPVLVTEETVADTEPTVAETIEETLEVTQQVQTPPEEPDSIAWWVALLVALGAAGIGVAVAIVLIQKK